MRVKNYIALLISASLISGGLLSAFIIHEYKKINQISSQYYDVELSVKNLQRVEAMLGHHFVEIDLILGSGDTYLIEGASQGAGNLVADLHVSKSSALPANLNLLIGESIGVIKEIDNMLGDVNRSLIYIKDDETKQGLLNDYLEKVDGISSQLVDDFPELVRQVTALAKDKKQALEFDKSNLRRKVINVLLVYLGFLIYLWAWISQKISRPLELLTESALDSATNGQLCLTIENGPAEVNRLSHRINALLTSLQHQATHDPLTGLYNRRVLTSRLQKIFQKWDKKRSLAVLCYMDLDRFKYVNDVCGHSAGDELLKNVAEILLAKTRKIDVVSRVGGDEFCLLFEECSLTKVLEIAENIREEIESLEFYWGNNRFDIGSSIGVAQIHDHFADVGEFINAADSACSMAKELGKNQIYKFDVTDTMLSAKRNDVQCVSRLNKALESDGFELFVQRILPVMGHSVDGKDCFEILLRMRSPDGELFEPTSFVPAAERYHMISKLDKWVIHNTISWFTSDNYDINRLRLCSINLSGQSLCRSDVLEFIQTEIVTSGISPDRLCFEITETAVISNIAHAKVFIDILRKIGCKFALDDFGSGLSSFGYLKELKVDFLKIDGRFVKGLANDPFDYAAVRSINEIASSCNLKTIAEFVNSDEVFNKLAEIGVDYAQGYYLDEPKSIETIVWDITQPMLKSIEI